MDDGLKQRIVGAFVLVAIGVVFIPVVFDRERIEPLDRKTQIPPAPHIETIELRKPIAPQIDEDAKPAKTMFLPDKKTVAEVSTEDEITVQPKKVEPVVKATAVLASDGTPKSWVLQVASYRFDIHAQEKRDELIAQGYSAYTRSITTDKGKMTRLYVGPNLDKAKIVAAKQAIDKHLGVDSIVHKFEP